MALDFFIVCKTYRGDLRRSRRLIESISQHNRDKLPLALIVPGEDLDLFRKQLPAGVCEFVRDEDVVATHPKAAALDLMARYRGMPGSQSQQVIKSEAWRLLGCRAYLCTDADAVFLRSFGKEDFVTPEGHIYTPVHESKDYRQIALARGQTSVDEDFREGCAELKAVFGRVGPDYDFGPLPTLWSAQVWKDLDERMLAPRGQTLWDAIDRIPSEIRWYGESLLAWKGVPLAPIEPLFRVYHHDWHYHLLRRQGETEATLARHFLGVVYQSNWEFELDEPGSRSGASRVVRRVKRWLGHLRG